MYLLASAEAIDFNGFDTKGFLKNFVVLMYLYIFADFLSHFEQKKNPIALKN